jgi:hypothetical protein
MIILNEFITRQRRGVSCWSWLGCLKLRPACGQHLFTSSLWLSQIATRQQEEVGGVMAWRWKKENKKRVSSLQVSSTARRGELFASFSIYFHPARKISWIDFFFKNKAAVFYLTRWRLFFHLNVCCSGCAVLLELCVIYMCCIDCTRITIRIPSLSSITIWLTILKKGKI